MNKAIMWDAQAGYGFVVSQTSHIEQQVNETIYPDIQYPSLIPVDTSAHPFARTVTYYSSDKVGLANWINGNADDMPLAGTERTKYETQVYTAGIGYSYGWEEIGQAQMLGYNLPADEAKAARRAYEEFVEATALDGDARKNLQGFKNHSAVTPGAATYGSWFGGTSDEAQILADVNNALIGIGTGTKWASMADTVVLPVELFASVASTRLGDTQGTILEFLQKSNVYTATTGKPLTIRGMRGLLTRGVGSTKRMIVYRKSPDVLKLHIPMPHRFLPAYQDGPLRVLIPGVFRLGGLDIRRPNEFSYIDGL